MSEETRQLVERLLAEYCRAEGPDLDAVGQIVSEDHVWVQAGGGEPVEGRRDYLRWLDDINEIMPLRTEAHGVIDCGPGRAIGVTSIHYRSATSGVESVQRRVVKSEAHTDPDAALEAAKARRPRGPAGTRRDP